MKKNVNFKLKSLRVERNLTQDELGKMIGIHEATYNRKEQGLNKFTLDEAKLIASIFDVPMEVIFFSKKVHTNKTYVNNSICN